MRLLAVLVATLSSFGLCAAVACSSSKPKVPTTSGVDPGDDASPRYLPDLTESEREKLCNWTAAIGGGYDASVVCDSGLVISSFTSLQQCLDSFLSACTTVTVSEWEACRNKEVSDPCAEYLYTAPECIPIQQCLGMTDGGPPQPEPEGGAEGGDL